jgi:hypothetical protein
MEAFPDAQQPAGAVRELAGLIEMLMLVAMCLEKCSLL